MRQQTRGARFGLESCEEFRSREAGAFGAQFDGFDGDVTANDRIDRPIDDTHGSEAEFVDNRVAASFRQCRHVRVGHEEGCPSLLSIRFCARLRRRLPTSTATDTYTPYYDSTRTIFARSTLQGY